MKSLATWCFRRRRTVLAVWLVALIGSFALSTAVGTNFDTKFQLPNTQSATVLSLLQKDFPAASGSSDQIVLHVSSGTVRDQAVRQAAQRMLAAVAAVPHVEAVAGPYASAGAAQVSKDGKTAFATVSFDEQSQSLPQDDVKRVITLAEAADVGPLQVALGGQDIEQAQSAGTSSSTGIGILLALIVLGLAFGALFAAFLPLITALVAIGVGYSLTGLLSHVLSVASFATILGVLIGLGVGVDYALLIVTRHRSGLTAGQTVETAAVNAVNTAGRAVFFAGLTVCIALLGQFALGVSFLYGIAIAAALTVALTMLASLTLLPALLGFFGDRVFSRRQRVRMRASGPATDELAGRWARWAEFIARRPTLPGIAAFVLVVVIGLPILTLHLGLDDAGSDAKNTTTHQAYDFIAEGVEVFVPVLMVSILFGLSMDYEVFLVSRMHEEWMRVRDNRVAVTVGQAATGRVISAAAAIMIFVFASFALGPNVVIKQFGLGLASAIIIDAFIVRTVLVPAVMHRLGAANWWLPRWLDRLVPQLNVEGADRDQA